MAIREPGIQKIQGVKGTYLRYKPTGTLALTADKILIYLWIERYLCGKIADLKLYIKRRKMRKIILYMASSIDGCIANADGGVDWLDTESDIGDEYKFSAFLQGIDTIVMGRKSYEQMLTFGEWPHSKCRTIVFSGSEFEPTTPNTTVVAKPNPAFVQELKQEKGKNIWLFGGGTLNHFFLENHLIDELMVFVQPVVLGTGIRLFGDQAVDIKKFKHKKSCELGGGFTLLWYEQSKAERIC